MQEKVLGISREFLLPPYGKQTFEGWMKKHTPLEEAGTEGTVALCEDYLRRFGS